MGGARGPTFWKLLFPTSCHHHSPAPLSCRAARTAPQPGAAFLFYVPLFCCSDHLDDQIAQQAHTHTREGKRVARYRGWHSSLQTGDTRAANRQTPKEAEMGKPHPAVGCPFQKAIRPVKTPSRAGLKRPLCAKEAHDRTPRQGCMFIPSVAG